jgi:hypothetical protein
LHIGNRRAPMYAMCNGKVLLNSVLFDGHAGHVGDENRGVTRKRWDTLGCALNVGSIEQVRLLLE